MFGRLYPSSVPAFFWHCERREFIHLNLPHRNARKRAPLKPGRASPFLTISHKKENSKNKKTFLKIFFLLK
ncbi:hypothetical protein DTW91_00270 [Chryseobacterium sp. SC28]|nr:hypothetical protein DTW91_00270 [Chryseobacterium sp. SC28]